MKTTIDKYGRIVIPKIIRENLRLTPGTDIELTEERDQIVGKPIVQEGDFVMKDGVLVFTGEILEDPDKILNEIRGSRIGNIAANIKNHATVSVKNQATGPPP